ncbi:hypothetical protein K435DRAFT_234557 [Dendrothele bispora CBS 962.96]|uniref:Zn(2)-C6 fungal-type domain-containing protein n=1 Tax=Dendrothele bispora (strain CBS 962.96) TaxID=1314807 RepID=A0A4S8LR77_DENBC|nr:hypothetical protein K435DRAFT_234557 [Dendrothele bispora CBS 962.96]
MGGDHKCPVCQATFTRPQHVARHMRSHTGDRPYKCQHCGDQFARSDLLSRHVNKCHAGEKPLNNAGNSRRKGSASATRATTSKQACDQCVQSSLPCDGCNPCAKCVQRKCRCTFVKFHRQTAPIGPGHNPRPTGNNPLASSLGSIGALGGLAGINGMGLNNLGVNGMLNPGIVPSLGGLGHVPGVGVNGLGGLNGPPLTTIGALGGMPLLPPGATSGLAAGNGVGPRNANGLPLYQQNASAVAAAAAASEPGATGTGEDFLAAANGAGSSNANGEIFTPSQFSFPSVYGAGSGAGVNGLDSGGLDDYANKYRAQQAELMRRGSIGHGYSSHHQQHHGEPARPHSSHSTSPTTNWSIGSLGSVNGWSTEPESYHSSHSRPTYMHPVYGHGHGLQRERRLSGEFSDVSGSGESGSMPSSATSSNVHLPLDNAASYSLNGRHSGSPPNNDPGAGSRPGTSHGEGGFHSAFGLMSLEDPAVLAGIQSDGAPFFSMMDQLGPEGMQNFGSMIDHSSDPNATPMPDKLQQLHAQAQAHVAAQQHQQQQQQQQQHGAQGQGNHQQQGGAAAGAGGAGGFAHPQHVRPSTGHGYPSVSMAYGMMTPGSREQETKELKDFWKAYMRTPLSGPGGGILAPTSPREGRDRDRDVHMLSPGLHGPPSGYRRQRVSSLPSAKTPTPLDESQTTGYYGGYAPTPGDKAYAPNASRSHPGTSQVLPPGGETGGAANNNPSGGTLHNTEDLRSYEAAVLARKAPTHLNLVPRTKKAKAATSVGSPSENSSMSPPPQSNNTAMNTTASSFSRESSSSLDGHNSDDGHMRRPSFKRLASQTLESQHAKRALLNRDRDVIGEFEFEDSGSSNSNSAAVSRPMSTIDHEEALADDEDESDYSSHHSQRKNFYSNNPMSIPRSETGSEAGSANASPIVGSAPSNAFLSNIGASPVMMYGSVPGKSAQTLVQKALMSGTAGAGNEMGLAEKRRRMSAPTSKSPTAVSFMEAGQL